MSVDGQIDNTISSTDEAYQNSGWLAGEDLLNEISKVLQNDNNSARTYVESAINEKGNPDFLFENLYGIVEKLPPTMVSVRLVPASSEIQAQGSSIFLLLVIDEYFAIDLSKAAVLYGPFETPPVSQSETEQTDDSNLDKIASTNASIGNMFSNLGLDSSYGISTSANRIVTEKRLQEQIASENNASTTSGNSLNSKGIYTNRPAVLINSSYVSLDTEASNQRYNASTLYQIRKNIVLKDYFDNFRRTDLEQYVEFEQKYIEFQQLIVFAQTMIDQIDQFKNDFIDTLDDYSNFGLEFFGFINNKVNPTKAFNQLIFDLGQAPFTGDHYFFNFVKGQSGNSRNLESTGLRAKNYYNFDSESGKDYLLDDQRLRNGSDSNPSLNGYKKNNEDNSIPEGFVDLHDYSEGIEQVISDSVNGDRLYETVLLAQILWCELYNSYVYSSSDSTEQSRLDDIKNKSNILYHLIGESFDSSVGLVGADNSSGIANILRYPERGNTVFPLESPGVEFESEDLVGIKNGVQAWINKNVGNVFEDRKLDFSGLNSWLENTNSFINKAKSQTDPYMSSGHGQLVFNEFIRSLESIGSLAEVHHMKSEFSAGNIGLDFANFHKDQTDLTDDSPNNTSSSETNYEAQDPEGSNSIIESL